ncbi:hypothetical protein HDU67_009736, partial [Dinochytrium kinnereticum]
HGAGSGGGYSAEKNKGSTIFGGSKILELKPSRHVLARPGEDNVRVVGIVTAVGFYSTRGELFRSILFPKEIDFKFYRDSFKFIAALSAVAMVAFINRVVNGISRDLPTFWVLVTSLDLITIAVPPALPLILTVGIGLALQRLKSKNIFCISPDRINYAGRIDVFCWDKTGTLTTPRLSWAGLDACTTLNLPEDSNRPSTSSSTGSLDSPVTGPRLEGLRQSFDHTNHINLERAVAVCHTLNEVQGELLGPPLEVELFRATGWRMVQDDGQGVLNAVAVFLPPHEGSVESVSDDVTGVPEIVAIPPSTYDVSREGMVSAPPKCTKILHLSPTGIAVLKRFEFDAQLQRCSVVFKEPSGTIMACVKGSPESVLRVCNPASIPRSYHKAYTRTGDGSMTAISVSRDLGLCTNMILVDIFEHGLGFQRLKDSDRIIDTREMVVSPTETAENSSKNQHEDQESVFESGEEDENQNNFEEEAMFEDYPSGSTEILTRVSIHDIARSAVSPPFKPTPIKGKHSCNPLHTKSLTHLSPLTPPITIQKPKRSSRSTTTLSFPIEELARTVATLENLDEEWDVAVTGAALDAMRGGGFEDGFLDWLVNADTYAGANDTGALKAAHVGLALSDSEASIVAPFTSVKRKVSDVIHLIAEGRCALDTSFIAFKYMFMYPIVQLAMVATLNQMGSGLSNNQFLFDDMAIVLVLAILMLRAGSSLKLGPSRPTDNLFSPMVMSSILGHVLISVGFFIANVASLYDQPWFCPIWRAKSGVDDETWLPLNASAPFNVSYPCYLDLVYTSIDPAEDVTGSNLVTTYENTAIWLFTHFQFAILALVFCLASPHRRPAWTNLWFTAYLLVSLISLSGMLLLSDDELGFSQFATLFNIREGVPRTFRVGVLFLATCNAAVSILWEVVVVDRVVWRWVLWREGREAAGEVRKMNAKAGITAQDANTSARKLRVRLDMAAAMRAASSWENLAEGKRGGQMKAGKAKAW